MAILIKNILNILKILVDNTAPRQITWSLLLGLGLGLSPTLSIQFFLILILLLLFNVQFSLSISSAFFFKLLFIPLTDTFHFLGQFVLTKKELSPLFTKMTNTPIIPYTNFNNTVVMGSLIFYLITLPVFYFLILHLVKKYQETIVTKIKKSKIYVFIKASFIVKWYEKYDRLYR